MSTRLTLKVRPLEVEVDLYLELLPDRVRAYALDQPGFFLDGPSEERILREAPTALWKFGHWLRNHGGEAPFRGALPRVRVAERVQAASGDGRGATVIFSPERRAPSPEQVALFRERLAWAQADLVGLVQALPSELLQGTGPGGSRVVEVLERLQETERAWVGRLSRELAPGPPTAPGPLEGFLETRRRALEALDRWPREAWGQVVVARLGPDGTETEEWSLSKLLRCLLTNQREQTAALRRGL